MAKRTPPRPSRTVTIKKFLDGKVRLERKNDAPMLYARAYLQGKYVVVRTKETNFARAQAFAENWYLELRDRIRRGEQLHAHSTHRDQSVHPIVITRSGAS